MQAVNLHTIFRALVDNQNYLKTVVKQSSETVERKINAEHGYRMLDDVIIGYVPLIANIRQDYKYFPTYIKRILDPQHQDSAKMQSASYAPADKYVRLGVQSKWNKLNNVSFFSSLSLLLHPYLASEYCNVQVAALEQFVEYIQDSILRNCQIDKIKNTKSMQTRNKKIADDLFCGNITHDVIQRVINICEINLLVFDLVNETIEFYWTFGVNHPALNLFKDVYCVTVIDNHYEPLLWQGDCADNTWHILQQHIYTQILLTNPTSVAAIQLDDFSLLYLEKWHIKMHDYMMIVGKYYAFDV